jgi:NADPH-dependent ferric siderophore reductase
MPGTSTSSSSRRVQRVQHEIRRRELRVVRVESRSPGFRRIVVAGESLAGFVSASFDDHVKLFIDTGAAEPVRRDFTPRRHDAAAGELTLDFALHDDGPASDWAAHARPGDALTVAGPRGSFIIPADFDWHLLVGDASALPAIERRLEELPAGTHALVLLRLDAADRRPLASAATLRVQHVDNDDALIDAVRALTLPPGEGYAWCAGEAATMASLRRVLVDEKGHDRHAIRAAAYWKRGAIAHHETLSD